MLRDAGIFHIRQEFTWEDIEIHGKGDFTDRRNAEIGDISAWDKYDNIVDLAEQYDIDILARISNPPAWSRAAGNDMGAQAPPDNYDDYADFVTTVVERYAGRITHFQLWNEPNIFPEWGENVPDPISFTDLLCRAYGAAKEANPDVVIVAPALSPTIALTARDANNLYYLQRMYLAGAGDCFDIFSVQGYGLFSGPTDHRLRPTVMNYSHHLYVRDLMVRHGDAHKPIWISEMNWNAVPDHLPETYGKATEAQQAKYIVEAYQRAQAEWAWVGVMDTWFFKRPSDSEQGESWYYFRLVEPDFTPLPVWDSLAEYAGNFNTLPTPSTSFWQKNRGQIRSILVLIFTAIFFYSLLHKIADQDFIDNSI